MTCVSLEEAGAQLARLIEEAGGEEVIITKDSQPVARLVPLVQQASPPALRKPGTAKDLILYMAEDFDAPLDDFKEYMEGSFCWIRMSSRGSSGMTQS